MKGKTLLILGVISLIYTYCTPFIFKAHVQHPTVHTTAHFGSPFPFVEKSFSETSVPAGESATVAFHSYFSESITFKLTPFLLSTLGHFVLLLAITYLASKFFGFSRQKSQ
ncbi:hypothetical protein [Priestia koreensis]|uniref:hypothetical protein n=1 Tax=Priestia koreensis TaxID=284581 RepID=UPI0020400E48|nr:hypothetical protein [Priestia koreensis]MCM3003167.1 hypothetical protein [Priestia koreensis]